MTVYVDNLIVWPNARGIFLAGSCHMAAVDLDELHEMARKIGMKREWFQDHPRHPHYDLVKSRRDKAIALGAVPVTGRELVKIWQEGRAK